MSSRNVKKKERPKVYSTCHQYQSRDDASKISLAGGGSSVMATRGICWQDIKAHAGING